MDIEAIWDIFLQTLSQFENIHRISYKKAAGIPFLYITAKEGTRQEDLEEAIRISAATAMKGKRLHSETIFVRSEEQLSIFRHRFFVPQKKMFCCGNLCPDCIRLWPE